MAYKSDTVASVIKRLNSQYFLPAIQREFIWNINQIVSLFDSIMRGYPISSFLFWEIEEGNRDKYQIYKFAENANYGGTHNELASVDGVHDMSLVLDGQQRLTSLLIGIKGTYTIKKKYRRWEDPSAWVKQRLYLDLFKDPKKEPEDGEAGIHYGFAFFENQPANDTVHHWFRVGRILDFNDEDRFYEFRQEEKEKLPEDITKAQLALFDRNLERLYRAIWKDDVISYHRETDQDDDRVLDIFVRANEGGTKLSKSHLLLSMVTYKWKDINAREEINGFAERLNNDLARRNDLDVDFIMKSCLVLSDLPVAYKVRNFNDQNLSLIQANWDSIKDALERAVDLTNTFGIDRDTLTAANALIPIAYYLYKSPDITLRGESQFDVRNAATVRQWFIISLLNGVFGGSSDSILTSIRTTLKKQPDSEFPIDELNKEIAKAGRKSYFDQQSIEDFLGTSYAQQLAFLSLSLLYEDNNWGAMIYHKDHIFPQYMFTWKHMREAGFNREEWNNYNELMDYLGNLELLISSENQEKPKMPFEKWIRTRDGSFKRRHLIPDNPELYRFENFEAFLEERERMIETRLLQLFGAPDMNTADT